MTNTILEAELRITMWGPTIDFPEDASTGAIAVGLAAFNSFVDGLTADDIPRAGRGPDESLEGLRFRFLVEDDGTAFVGGRIS